MRALDALGAYVDQVALEQGGLVDPGAAHYKQTLISTPKQPDSASCGVCVLIEIQRIADGNIDPRRDPCSDVAELLRLPAPTSSRDTDTAAGGRAARTVAGIGDVETGEAQPPGARKRARAPLDGQRGTTKQKRRPSPGDRKRDDNPPKPGG